MKRKYLTTGQVAAICGVAPRTASKWIDSGRLTGWRIPGSRDRRVSPEDLAEFMQKTGIPAPPEAGPVRTVLLVGPDAAGLTAAFEAAGWRAVAESSHFRAGARAAEAKPAAIVVDLGDGLVAAQAIWLAAAPTPVVLYGSHERWPGRGVGIGGDAVAAVEGLLAARKAPVARRTATPMP